MRYEEGSDGSISLKSCYRKGEPENDTYDTDLYYDYLSMRDSAKTTEGLLRITDRMSERCCSRIPMCCKDYDAYNIADLPGCELSGYPAGVPHFGMLENYDTNLSHAVAPYWTPGAACPRRDCGDYIRQTGVKCVNERGSDWGARNIGWMPKDGCAYTGI
jgi:hypothetical protein